MSVRTLIVAKSKAVCDHLSRLCDDNPETLLLSTCSDRDELSDILTPLRPDLVIIEAQDSLVRKISEEKILHAGDEPPYFAFVSSSPETAIVAFEFDVIDCMAMPITESRFAVMIDRVLERLYRDYLHRLITDCASWMLDSIKKQASKNLVNYPERLVAHKGDRLALIDVESIDYLKSDRNRVEVFTGSESYILRCTMRRIEGLLAPSRFLRIRRSIIVNKMRIKELERWFHGQFKITLDSGVTFTTGPRYKNRLLGYMSNEAGTEA